jgi:hypothetical protein
MGLSADLFSLDARRAVPERLALKVIVTELLLGLV